MSNQANALRFFVTSEEAILSNDVAWDSKERNRRESITTKATGYYNGKPCVAAVMRFGPGFAKANEQEKERLQNAQ